MAAVQEIHTNTFCSVNNAGTYSFTSIAKLPALHLWHRRQQPIVKAGFGLFNFSLICVSMVVQFLTFVPHSE